MQMRAASANLEGGEVEEGWGADGEERCRGRWRRAVKRGPGRWKEEEVRRVETWGRRSGGRGWRG